MTEKISSLQVPALNAKPWISSGKVPDLKYSYTPSGLTPLSYPIRPASSIPNSRPSSLYSRSFINPPKDSKETIQPRDFREYNFLREQEVLLTIEHCDNCQEHSVSTRHDAEKYSFLAKTIKSSVLTRFPMVKVLIKPLSKLDPEVKKHRLGAFEVQMAKKFKGTVSVILLHSKLSERKWPALPELLLKVSQNLPTFQLFVTVFDEVSGNKNMKGLKVQIRQTAPEVENRRPSSGVSRPRPMSAVSSKSFKSQRPSSAFRQKKVESLKATVYCKVTDRDGMCLFDGVPQDKYEIEVLDSRDYRGAVKVFNSYEEKMQNLSMNVYIGVKPRENSFLSVTVKDAVLKSPVTCAKVAILRESEEFLLAEVREGTYEISIPKGEYFLAVQADRFKEVYRKISANDLQVFVCENLELSSLRELTVLVFNAITGEAVNEVFLKLIINGQKSYSGTTRNGKISLKLEETGFFYIKAKTEDFLTCKIFMTADKNLNLINVGLVPDSLTSPVLVVSWSKQSDDIEVQGLVNFSSLSLQNCKVGGYEMIDRMKSHGISTILCPEQGHHLRLSICGLSQELIEKDGFCRSGVNVQFYSFHKIRASLKPAFGTGEWWDCGWFLADKLDFFETNLLLGWKPKQHEYFHEICQFVRSLYFTESLKSLGFQHGISKQSTMGKDVILSPEVFKKYALASYPEDFSNLFIQSLMDAEGVSLGVLTLRYEKFVELGVSPYKNVRVFIQDLGIEQDLTTQEQRVVEHYFNCRLPPDWDIKFDQTGKKLYFKDDLVTEDYPTLFLCKERLLHGLRSFEQASPKSSAKSLHSEKRSQSRSSSNRKSSLSKNSSSGSSQKPKEIENLSEKKSETGELKEIKQQCQKLANFATQSIDFYLKSNQFDNENHSLLIDRIQVFKENCDQQLESELSSPERKFFTQWSKKFTVLLVKLKEIQENIHSSNNH